MRKTLKKFIPQWLLTASANAADRHRHRSYKKLPVDQVFAKIYSEKEWGSNGDAGFYSGAGSHDPAIVEPYVQAVTEYLKSWSSPPIIVDLGCGDFNVGKHFVDFRENFEVLLRHIVRNQQKDQQFDGFTIRRFEGDGIRQSHKSSQWRFQASYAAMRYSDALSEARRAQTLACKQVV